MTLHKVTGQFVFVFCCNCGVQTAGGNGAENWQHSPAWYDADGKPFVAYYCDECAKAQGGLHESIRQSVPT
jgi:hypothetical protein